MPRFHATANGPVPFTSEEEAARDAEEAAWTAKQAATAYAKNRAGEYPAVVDQLDTIFHNGLDAWKAQIQAVKDKYPKPE
jgi:hypothetical protein